MKKNKILALVLAVIMVMSLSGCGMARLIKAAKDKGKDAGEKVTNQTESTESTEDNWGDYSEGESDYNSNSSTDTLMTMKLDESGKVPEDMAVAFIRYVINRDYGSIIPLVYGDTKVVSAADIEQGIKKNFPDDLVKLSADNDYSVEVDAGEVEDNKVVIEITLNALGTEYTNTLYDSFLVLRLDENNLWRVSAANEFSNADVGLVIPKDCELYIDGNEIIRDVDALVKPYEKDNKLEIWKFDEFGISEKQITVKSNVFEVTTPKVIENGNFNTLVELEVDEEVINKAREFIKDSYAVFMKDSCEGTLTYETVAKYVSDNATVGTAQNLFNICKDGTKNVAGKRYKDVQPIAIVDNPVEVSTWVGNSWAKIDFGMSVTWEDPGTGYTSTPKICDMDLYSFITLDYDGENFKIAEIDQHGLYWKIMMLNDAVDDF